MVPRSFRFSTWCSGNRCGALALPIFFFYTSPLKLNFLAPHLGRGGETSCFCTWSNICLVIKGLCLPLYQLPLFTGYSNLPFTVQDTDSSRKDRASVSELEKLVGNILEDTNWRLLSNSVFYRLGYLEGRLKGYENEEDMLKLAGKKEEVKPKAKIDDEKRRKYEYHNIVQLARLLGEHEGVERLRKRRLKNEPEGFFLEASEGPYQCGICAEYRPGNEIWWNIEGLRCADCRKNIKEGVIPSLKHRYDNGDTYFQDWQIQSDYGVHPATRSKLRREGLLKGRDLKNEKGQIYCTIYLVSENREFLKKYPKKEKIKVEFINSSDGKKIQL